jgi:hypothetical protein
MDARLNSEGITFTVRCHFSYDKTSVLKNLYFSSLYPVSLCFKILLGHSIFV